MEKTLFFVTWLFVSLSSTLAQSAFPVLGGEVSGSGGSLSYTVGQLTVAFKKQWATNAGVVEASINEGVHQTYRVDELDINGVEPIGIGVHIYPNPTTDNVRVTLENPVLNLQLELYTIDGQLLQQESIPGAEQTIDMRHLPSGSYMLRASEGKKENRYRIIKIR